MLQRLNNENEKWQKITADVMEQKLSLKLPVYTEFDNGRPKPLNATLDNLLSQKKNNFVSLITHNLLLSVIINHQLNMLGDRSIAI